MKKSILFSIILLFLFSGIYATNLIQKVTAANPKIYIAFQWHDHQPVYWPGETVIETVNNNRMTYNLLEVFTSRTGPYTTYPTGAITRLTNAGLQGGAQISFSGSLIDNLNILEQNNVGSFKNWKNVWNEALGLKTALGNPRIDMVGFGHHHPLMSLSDYEDIRYQVKKHRETLKQNFPNITLSKGFFPPECAFDISIIPALVDEGVEWVFVDNVHFDRTAKNYPWVKEFSIVEPNRADQRNPDPNDWVKLEGLYAPGKISAGWGHRPHLARYIDPNTGQEKKITVVPASLLYGNEDGRGGFGALQYEKTLSQLESYNTDPNHPILVVMHHDGDNHGGGSSGYYTSNFDNFIQWLKDNPDRFECTTVQDYLDKFPPAENDYIHVEPGSWYGAGADPEFLKWNGDPGVYSLNGTQKATDYSPDRNSWSIVTAAANIVKQAEAVSPNSEAAKNAREYLAVSRTSCYWYWDGTEEWDSHPARACNLAVDEAMKVLNSSSQDNIGPNIYRLQREAYNPGATEWNATKAEEFQVWTYVYDYSGLSKVSLKYRIDGDGILDAVKNDTYEGSAGIGEWVEVPMISRDYASITNPLPKFKASEYSTSINPGKNVMVDYYVEAIDTKGNITRSDIHHTWVGGNSTQPPIDPPVDGEEIIIRMKKPEGWSTVNMYAWTGTNTELVGGWPGTSTTEIDGWWTYTFKSDIAINLVFSSNGNPQSIDITGIAQSTCYEEDGSQNGKITVKVVDCPVSNIHENELVGSVFAFPNPAVDIVYINGVDNIAEVSVLNINGAAVKKVNDKSNSVNVGDLPTGVYFISVKSIEGKSHHMKFIKK